MALSYSLLARIRSLAVIAGYNIELGNRKLLRTTEHWWNTLKLSNTAVVQVAMPDGFNLSKVSQTTRKGVKANLVLSMGLKCAIGRPPRTVNRNTLTGTRLVSISLAMERFGRYLLLSWQAS